jgi:hypothetical protein
MVSISRSQALAWRMRQQLLDPVGAESVAVAWFADGGPPGQALAEEVARLATILDRPLQSPVETAYRG